MGNYYQKFVKDVVIIGATNIITAICSIIFLPLITKTLGANGFGIWKQVEVTTSLSLNLVGLGLPYALTRFLPAKSDKREIRDDFYSVFFVVFILTLLFLLMLTIFAGPIARAFFNGSTNVVKITGLIIMIWSLNTVFISYLRSYRHMKTYALITIADACGQLIVITYLALNGYGLFSMILTVLVIKMLIFFVLLFFIVLQIGLGKPHFRRLKDYLRFGLPTIPGNIGSWVVNLSDRYVVGYVLGISAVGIYSVGYGIGGTILALSGVLDFVLPPALAKLYDEGRIEEVKALLRYSLKYLLAIAIPFVFGAAVLSKPILTLFSTPDIAKAGYFVTPIIALGTLALVLLNLSGQILVLAKKTHIIGTAWILGGLVNLITNIIVVPTIGILGASISTAVSYILIAGLIGYYAFKEFRFSVDWQFILKSLVASTIMSFVLWQIKPTTDISTIVTVLVGVASYGALIVLLKGFNKEEIVFFRRLFQRA